VKRNHAGVSDTTPADSNTCKPEALRNVPLFAQLDDDETAVLASQVEVNSFNARECIYKIGDSSLHAYVMVSGRVRVTTVDEDQQEVVVDEPMAGDFFGFASMLERTPHQTSATALEDTTCLEVSRESIAVLLQQKPLAGMDLLATLGHQFHTSQRLVRLRASRNPNEVIEEKATFGERTADLVARFGGSWTFVVFCLLLMSVYALVNIRLRGRAWDPYPFILLNLFLSMLAAIQAPVIMMSQNRQDTKDRLRSELDFNINRLAEAEIQGLARRLDLLDRKIGDVGNMLRSWGELPLHSQTAGLAERSQDQPVANVERSDMVDSETFTVFGQT
jgi:CRP/FNR family transcriptional regulator, cyclic AMP receptor protein